MDESKVVAAVKAGITKIVDDSGAASADDVQVVIMHIASALVAVVEGAQGTEGVLCFLAGLTSDVLADVIEPRGTMQ